MIRSANRITDLDSAIEYAKTTAAKGMDSMMGAANNIKGIAHELKYIKEENITHLIAFPGDVVFFDCNIMHGSSHNMSPINRHTFIIVYNSIDNKPVSVANPRPDWVVSRQFDIVK